MDGAISDNLPRCHQKNTITFSAYAGENDICPRASSLCFHEVRFSNVSIQVNSENLYRVTSTFFPPEPEVRRIFSGFSAWVNLSQTKCISLFMCLKYTQILMEHLLVEELKRRSISCCYRLSRPLLKSARMDTWTRCASYKSTVKPNLLPVQPLAPQPLIKTICYRSDQQWRSREEFSVRFFWGCVLRVGDVWWSPGVQQQLAAEDATLLAQPAAHSASPIEHTEG